MSALAPEGLVRVHSETWSATSLNGNVPAGGRVQVIGAKGVRLEVWGEDVIQPQPDPLVVDHATRIEDEPNRDTSENRRAGW